MFRRLDRYKTDYPFAVFARALGKNVAKRFLYPARRPDRSIDELPEAAMPPTYQPGSPNPIFLELLEVFFRWGGYPHQQIAFGFSVLLWGREKHEEPGAQRRKSEVTGSPSRVVEELGAARLGQACEVFVEELSGGRGNTVRTSARPLHYRMELTNGVLFSSEPSIQRLLVALQDTYVKETELSAYFGKDPQKSVSDWVRGVRKRVERVFTDPLSVRNIRLPQEPQVQKEASS